MEIAGPPDADPPAMEQNANVDTYLDESGEMTANMFRSADYRMYWWTFGRWIALVGLIGLLATSLLIAGDLLSSLWSISLGLSLGLLVVSVIAGLVRQLVRGRSALTEGRFHFLAREDGLTVEGPFGAQTIRWTAYKRAYRDNRFVYLVLSSQVAQVIPLSIVANNEPILAHLRDLDLLQRTPRAFFIA